MPYTKQDCLDKIQDISTNLQSCLTTVAAKGVTVPADSSLDDLATLITAIPDASHPDYDLPWIMNDGSSGIWCPDSAGRSATVWIDCELTPTDNTHVRLFGCQGTSLSNWGMDYNDTHVRSLRTLTKDIGTSTQGSDTANTASTNWSGYPFYKRQELEASWTANYRASILYNGSWTHAATSAAQQSTSNTPNMPFSLFCSIRYTSDGLTFPANSCKAGTKVYSVKRGTGSYTSTTWTTYSPVLRWDPVKKEYRATLVNKELGRQWSFAKDGKYTEDGNMYYIDVTKGLAEKTGYSQYNRYAYTDIPNSSSYRYVLKIAAERRNAGDAVNYITAYDTSDGYSMSIGNFISSGYTQFLVLQSYGGNTYSTYSDSIGSASVNHILIVDFASKTMMNAMEYLTSNAGDTKTLSSPTVPESDRGKICLVKPHGTTYNDALYSVMIYEGDTLIHYLVYCSMPGKTKGVFYDCVTKKTYDIE